jgi:hypothetical protein
MQNTVGKSLGSFPAILDSMLQPDGLPSDGPVKASDPRLDGFHLTLPTASFTAG